MTYARRTDAPHAAIRNALRQMGYKVKDCSRFGEGFPDLLVIDGSWSCFMEVKTPGNRNRLTKAEKEFREFIGEDRYRVVCSVDEAIEIVRGREG